MSKKLLTTLIAAGVAAFLLGCQDGTTEPTHVGSSEYDATYGVSGYVYHGSDPPTPFGGLDCDTWCETCDEGVGSTGYSSSQDGFYSCESIWAVWSPHYDPNGWHEMHVGFGFLDGEDWVQVGYTDTFDFDQMNKQAPTAYF